MSDPDYCQCPAPTSGTGKETDFGRGWNISADWETWTCTRCQKVAQPSHVAVLAGELIDSIPTCEAIYRGEKP